MTKIEIKEFAEKFSFRGDKQIIPVESVVKFLNDLHKKFVFIKRDN